MIVLDDEIVHSLWAKELEEFKDVKIKSFMNGEDFQEWLPEDSVRLFCSLKFFRMTLCFSFLSIKISFP